MTSTVVEKLKESVHNVDCVIRDINYILDSKRESTEAHQKFRLNNAFEEARVGLAYSINLIEAKIITDFSKVPEIISIKPHVSDIFSNLLSSVMKFRFWKTRVISEGYSDFIRINFSDNGIGTVTMSYGNQVFSLCKKFHNHAEKA